jgi:hypothetical protein
MSMSVLTWWQRLLFRDFRHRRVERILYLPSQRILRNRVGVLEVRMERDDDEVERDGYRELESNAGNECWNRMLKSNAEIEC